MQKIEHFFAASEEITCNDLNTCGWTIGMERSMINADTIKRLPNDIAIG